MPYRMKNRRHRLTLLGMVVCALGLVVVTTDAARAASVVTATFETTDDAHVAENAPSTNYGGGTVLTATGARGARKVIYLRFNVTGVPSGATGVSANLKLSRTAHHLPANVTGRKVVDTAWSESTVTYDNAPPLGGGLGTVYLDRTSSTVSFAATDVTGGSRVYSYALTTSVANDTARFWSGESGSGPRPTLTVRYTPPDPMWIGATVNRPDASVGSFDVANDTIGPLRYRRCFNPVLPKTFQDSCARHDAAHGYRSFVSWKPPGGDFVGAARGAYDTAVTEWARSVPPHSDVYATAFHEPENDMTGPQFVAMQCHLYRVVKAANPSIRWGPVYMSYWWEPGRLASKGGAGSWWVGSDCADFTGVDTYADKPAPLSGDSEFRGWYDYMLDKGEPMLIVEYGQYAVGDSEVPDPAKYAARARTIRTDAAWLRDQGVIRMWLYWDGAGEKGDWSLTDSGSQGAWREVAAGGRVS
ncbi:MAG: DNRLRE domain-containing protein [Acidimicrobiales bacterium]